MKILGARGLFVRFGWFECGIVHRSGEAGSVVHGGPIKS